MAQKLIPVIDPTDRADGYVPIWDASGGVHVYVPAGGSPGKAWFSDNYDLRDYPASPNSLDDEFEGGGAIDAKWTKVNDPSDPDDLNQSDIPGFLTVGLTELGTDNFANLIQLYQTAPSGTATAEYLARVALALDSGNPGMTDGGEFATVDLALINSVNSQSVGAALQSNVGDLQEPLIAFASADGTSTFASTLTQKAIGPGQFVYLRLRKLTANAYTSANDYEMAVSADGIVWGHLTTGSKTFTTACDRVGLMFRRPKSQASTPHGKAVVDFFRKTA